MIIDRACHRTTNETRARSVARHGALALLAVAAAGTAVMTTAAPSSAAPTPAQPAPNTQVLLVDVPEAGPPMPVPTGSFGYLATHDLTKRMASMKTAEAIAALPVPEQYRPANMALAKNLDLAVKGALADPKGCVQVIVDPRSTSGGLFDYGFYAVSGQYCP
ncbi:hypothetical protein GPOL_c19570 [Gordonia polyisoprenivorans VH2]|uniref:DUF732 domain-containing protein n=2 Tax=Gordonia polyisoprenivorans TaxID=84595 RepID=H6MX74_GORPV|nr:hypothetical protein [Gordonia polyisoprenivorans]AFA72996.1 hypothetical protein GPOL_c19570 [Gordonia polyisoprenivorans VH2]NKY02602.1 hypothetical protein [Gordonia polyisoprenivorans]QUD80879.1 hypothetical protein J8M97_13450 [Gordonia polyisoprenivorans]UZF58417.1 hypothetical protein LH935_10825 [Gordonia polyisoprenivorans]GAB24583.1 hypothetical protein GOPIP_070_00620 [Gordonia polyisoprenivorans NBRC 16320 = JCM 10675]